MARLHKPRQEKKLYLFCCEDSKSSRFYLDGLRKELGINIRTCCSQYRTPASLERCLKKEIKQRGQENIRKSYILFDKDDMSMNDFKCEAKKYNAAVSVPCYEYWLLLHIYKTDKSFSNSNKCGEFLVAQIKKQQGIDLSLDQLKKEKDIFDIVEGRQGLKRAIENAKGYSFTLGDDPYTNMHTIIEGILQAENITL